MGVFNIYLHNSLIFGECHLNWWHRFFISQFANYISLNFIDTFLRWFHSISFMWYRMQHLLHNWNVWRCFFGFVFFIQSYNLPSYFNSYFFLAYQLQMCSSTGNLWLTGWIPTVSQKVFLKIALYSIQKLAFVFDLLTWISCKVTVMWLRWTDLNRVRLFYLNEMMLHFFLSCSVQL